MKKLILFSLLSFLLLPATYAQYRTERTGYEGDYFSLEGALDLFRRSATLRDFERKINTEENWVNNLDLNYDGRIDYIRVEHRRQGNFHAVILQAVLDRYAVQDVAVIEIEVIGRGEAVLQIVGDEDLYGEEVFVEPVEGYADSRSGYHPDYGNYINVYYWEPVQYILRREYAVYVSPYRWSYYPDWWNPWAQYGWNAFRPRVVVYVNHYHVVPRHRVIRVHHFYRPYRSYCPTVVQRANQVRVSHGGAPVHRSSPGVPERSPGVYRPRREVSERPAAAPRSQAPRPGAPASRNRTESSTERSDARSRNSREYQRNPGSAGNPEAPRPTARPAAPRESPSVSRKSPSVSDPIRSRSTSPQVRPPSGSAPNPPRATGRPADSRERSAARPNSERSAAPRVDQPSRNQTVRPSTPTRSRTDVRPATPERKPEVRNSGRAAPGAKPGESREASENGSGSRSRKGRGN